MFPSDAAYSESGEIGITLTSEDDVCEGIETCPPFVTSNGSISEDDPTPRATMFNSVGLHLACQAWATGAG